MGGGGAIDAPSIALNAVTRRDFMYFRLRPRAWQGPTACQPDFLTLRQFSAGAQTWHSQLPVAWHNTSWTADRAIEWLKHGRGDEPFCTWISFPDPHHPFDAPEPWSRLHDPKDVDLPKHRKRSFEGRPWWHEAVLTAEPTGDKKGAEIRKSYSRIAEQSDDQLREIIANTYGQIALIDHNVGRILMALDEIGIADNTIVIYISDHGDWLGDHGLILKGPMHYDGLLRVPMIVRGPNVPKGKKVDEPVSTLDLGPTFFDYGQAKALQTQHGETLRPLVEGDNASRDYAMNEWELLPTRAGVGLSLRTVRTKTHKLTIDLQSEAGEMYDLASDPDEIHNLFDDPAHQAIKDTLMGYIHARPDDAGPIRQQVGMA